MSAADRVRTAAEATAASIVQIRPLTLPNPSAVPAELRRQRSRKPPRESLRKFRETWMIPLGAAAVVVALALTLVILRSPAPPPQRRSRGYRGTTPSRPRGRSATSASWQPSA